MRHRPLLLALFVAVASIRAGSAHADPDPARPDTPRDPAAADALFWEGRAAADAGDYRLACDKFRQSQRLDPSAGTLFNLAHCEDKLGRVASASRHYREASAQMKDDDRRAAFARDRAAALEPRVPRLTIVVIEPRPDGLQVTRDRERVDDASFGVALGVDPGTLELRVTASGRADRAVAIAIAEGESKTIQLEPGPALAPIAPRPVRPSLAARPADRAPSEASSASRPAIATTSSGRSTAGWALVGGGAASVVLGAVAGAMVLREKGVFADHCDPSGACRDQAGLDAADRGTTWATVSTVAFATGAVAATVGVVLLATNRPAAAKRAAAIFVGR